MSNKHKRHRRRYYTLLLLLCIAVFSIFRAFNLHFLLSYIDRVPFMGIYEEDNLHLNDIEIDELWFVLFYCEVIVFNDQFHHFIETEKNKKNSTFPSFINCNNDIKIKFHKLLMYTKDYFINYKQESLNNITYHQLISIRRRIMMLYNLKKDINMITSNDTNTYITILNKLKIFESNHYKYRIKNKYIPFHIHLSKAAGKMIRKDFINNLIGKEAWKLFRSQLNCNNIYQHIMYNGSKKGYIEREDIMYNILCNNMFYIMPIREPIERICSQSSQFNDLTKFFSKQSLFKSYKSWYDIHKHDQYMDTSCIAQNITINGKVWKKLIAPIDFKNFFIELLESEQADSIQLIQPNMRSLSIKLEKQSIRAQELDELILPKCSNQNEDDIINNKWLKLMPLRYNEKDIFDSKFMYATSRRHMFVDAAWVRTKAGSNMYTTWLGYNTSLKFKIGGNYVPRWSINFGHFINALRILLSLDYVIPIKLNGNDSKLLMDSSHELSQIVYNDIENYGKLIYNVKNKGNTWSFVHSSNNDGLLRLASTAICNIMSEKEKNVLRKYNQYDIVLYELSKMIDPIDVQFHHYK